MLSADYMSNGTSPKQCGDGPLTVHQHPKSDTPMQGIVGPNECKSNGRITPDKDGLKMAAAVTRPTIARPVPDSATKTYVTCAPIHAHSASNGMDTSSRQSRKAHSLSSGPLNAATKTPPYSRHSRPAGTTTPCQDAPLDLTKPLDLSVKNKPAPKTAQKTSGYELSHQCYRESHLGGLPRKDSPAVVTPFNVTNLNKTVPFAGSREHSQDCSRRMGLMASSPRNYNYKGRAMVAPRREHVSEILQQGKQLLNPPRRDSTLLNHDHIPVQNQSVPYSHVTHSLSPANSFPVTTSSSGHILLPPYQTTSSSSYHAMHHELRHKPILPKPSAVARPITAATNMTSNDSEGQMAPTRIAHVTAFSHTSTTYAHTLTPATQSHSASSLELPGQLSARMHHDNQPVGYHSPSNFNRYANSLSNGTLSMQKKKNMRRSHSVSPMRPSRNNYNKSGNDRHNIRVIKMLESSIVASAKLHKLLKPIDGPEAPPVLLGDSHMVKDDTNNNHTHRMATYNQPLRVDIPEQHSPSMPCVPPSLPNAFTNDRALSRADHIESCTYSTSKLHQLSPPSSTVPNDRISPTMPVLVPHSMYSPVERPTATTHAVDSNLPVLKNAKLEGSTHSTQPVFNPLTLPFLSSVVDSRKVQTVPPIISEPRQREETRCARHSQQSLHPHHDATSASRTSTHGDIQGMDHIVRQELNKLLMHLGRKTAAAASSRRTNPQVSHSAVTATLPSVANTSNSTMPYPKLNPHVSSCAPRTHRTVEEDREIFRKMLLQKRAMRKQALEVKAKQHFGSNLKQEPEVVDLTCSPPLSPGDVKQDSSAEELEETRYFKMASLQKVDQNREQPPRMGEIKTASTTDRPARLDVAGKSLTVKEAIEAAYGLPPSSETFTNLQRTGNLDGDIKKISSATEKDWARSISLVENTQIVSDTKEHHGHTRSEGSYCQRHRRLLFPSVNTQQADQVKHSVAGIPKRRKTTTLSQVITDHFITHDPRKKHLASMVPKRKSPSTSRLVADKENPPADLQSFAVTTTTPPTPAHSSPLSNADQQRRPRKPTLEMNRIANTASYVGDLPKKPRTGDLLVDSSLLDREERALQRAMLRFSEMEQQERLETATGINTAPQETVQKVNSEQKRPRGRPPRGRGRGLNRATKLLNAGRKRKLPWRLGRPRIARRESPRKRCLKVSTEKNNTEEITDGCQDDGAKETSQKLDDFKPKIQDERTRNTDTTRRNSVRKRTPYHKNARYELEIEKEEAKLVERKRKRTVSYSGSNSGADTTDESPTTAGTQPQLIQRRGRGRPRKTESEKLLVAAAGKRIKIKYKGVGRGRYPRVKKKVMKKSNRCNVAADVSKNEAMVIKSEYCSSDNSVDSSPFKGGLQRPLQVVMDPDNHTKMKFVSLPHLTPTGRKKRATTAVASKPRGKRKQKTKHLDPVSPNLLPFGYAEDVFDVFTFSCAEDDTGPKRVKMKDEKENVSLVQIKQEPEDQGYEPQPVPNQPPPVQIVRPDPPIELKRLICNKKLGETVLHRACRMAKDEVAIYCIDYQMCDINAKDNAGYTSLHECCVNGRLQIAQHLLRHGADVNASAADGTRPLHDAVDNHHIEIVRLLLAFGADPLVATYSGRTPLKLARNKQMRAFIIGYLRDVNGQWEVDEEEYPDYVEAEHDSQWRFRGSCSLFDSKSESAPSVFDDIPDDDTADVMFELSDTPHLPTYNLELARDNGPRNWLLLSDLKKALGGKLDDVINTCEDVQPITITRREFSYALKEGLTSVTSDPPPKEHGHVSDSDTVELVELSDSMRRALDIDTEFVR